MLDVLHVICTRLRPGHFSACVEDGSGRSEEIVKKKKKSRIAPLNAIVVVIIIIIIIIIVIIILILVVVVVVVTIIIIIIIPKLPNTNRTKIRWSWYYMEGRYLMIRKMSIVCAVADGLRYSWSER